MKTIPVSLVLAALLPACPMLASEVEEASPERDGRRERPERPERPEARERTERDQAEARREAWMRADTDGDGVISREEFDAIERLQALPEERRDEIFARLDKNGDGVISADELAPPRPPDEPGPLPSFRRWLDADADGDGVSFEEFRQAEMFRRLPEERVREIFDRLDTDGDGRITSRDRPEPRGERGGRGGPPREGREPREGGPRPPRSANFDPARWLRQFDTDEDGAVTFEEFRQAPWLRQLSEEDQRARFDAMDRNGDGRITIEDFPSPEERAARGQGREREREGGPPATRGERPPERRPPERPARE